MATLVRVTRTRYVNDEGRRVGKETPGARKITEKSRYWYAQGLPGWPPSKRKRMAANKTAAQQMMADLIRNLERGEAKLDDAVTQARRKSVKQHLDDFKDHLTNKPNSITPKQIKLVMNRCLALVEGCGFEMLPNIDPEKVSKWLAEQRAIPADDGGISVRTSNFYIGAMNQFLRWLKKNKRIVSNPLDGLERGNPNEDLRHPRRSVTPDEVGWLMRTVEASPRATYQLPGKDRWMLYAVAASTGFRAKELRDLTPDRFQLDATPPQVQLPGKQAKNRKKAIQPLPVGLVPFLREYLANKPKKEPIWGMAWYNRAADMLKKDLVDATTAMQKADPSSPGIPYQTDEGFFDFHGWRHSFVTWLDGTGASTKTAQTLARHSDPRLTLNTYSHAQMNALAEAVNKLPLPLPGANREEEPPPTYEQLVALVAIYGSTLAFILGACRGASNNSTERDTTGHPGTEKQGEGG